MLAHSTVPSVGPCAFGNRRQDTQSFMKGTEKLGLSVTCILQSFLCWFRSFTPDRCQQLQQDTKFPQLPTSAVATCTSTSTPCHKGNSYMDSVADHRCFRAQPWKARTTVTSNKRTTCRLSFTTREQSTAAGNGAWVAEDARSGGNTCVSIQACAYI